MSPPTYNSEVSVVADEQTPTKVSNDALWANRIAGLLAWAGVFVAGVLSFSHYFEKSLPCGTGSGCDLVTQSEYSMFLGIPVALIGLLGYVILAALSVLRPLMGKPKWRLLTNISFGVSALGFLSSVYFIFVSLSILHATCSWCITSAIIMSLSFIVTGWLWSCPDPDAKPQGADSLVQVGGLILAIGAYGVETARMDHSMDDVKGVKIGSIREAEVVPIKAKIRGGDEAVVTIVEFADFNCPSCRTAAPEMQEIYEKAGGKIRWAFRNVPLVRMKGHETSMVVATVSELAAQKGLFWQFFDAAYKVENTERIKSIAGIKEVGREAGLDPKDMEEAISPDSEAAKGVIADMDLSLRLGIEGTPTFVILAKDAKPKAVTARRLKTLLEEQPYKGLLGGN